MRALSKGYAPKTDWGGLIPQLISCGLIFLDRDHLASVAILKLHQQCSPGIQRGFTLLKVIVSVINTIPSTPLIL